MPYLQKINHTTSISVTERKLLIDEFDLLRAELDDLRTKYAAALAKLDADAGVTDTNYAATCAPAAARFTRT